MHINYKDILDLTDKKPLWFDQNGTPRFAPFHPRLCPNIYARQAVLYRIACQNCGHIFDVADTCGIFAAFDISEKIMAHKLHYGDPPNIGCCPAGPTMSCEDLRIIEFWNKPFNGDWERIKEMEILLPEHPDYEGDVEMFDKGLSSLDKKDKKS
jgi:hypothetical protein